MRCSGVHWFHTWRVLPARDEDDALTFTAFIDGKDMGAMMSVTIEDAVIEVRQMVEQMMKEGQ